MAFIVPSKRITQSTKQTKVNFQDKLKPTIVKNSGVKTQVSKQKDRELKSLRQKIFIEQQNYEMLSQLYIELQSSQGNLTNGNSCYQAILEAEDNMLIQVAKLIAPAEQASQLILETKNVNSLPQLHRLEAELLSLQTNFLQLQQKEDELDQKIKFKIRQKYNNLEQQLYQ
ncbi:hypothetical protein SS50377_23464 [Spironucleus salmonicida]|uniref:Uncharacterized protein n=1 Tax=Spironucleus salmonicida TaxID=348837 RepID=V6LNG1_9EUKA|nr:hypothetical protein SS50377_28846 [Spironucleus salmonicida]KAH0573530.1 hypothetical protein SS50377_23464 [Spironucleus salmonicida]|eukprot:EST46202.1 Hypothetical protein SS50377_13797 [Spironucleus salmonicida]